MFKKNVRQKLLVYEYEWHTFTAEFDRFGFRRTNVYHIATVLLTNVKDERGIIVANHLWLKRAKPFYEANLMQGDIVQFRGCVGRYQKGSHYKIIDFCIYHPTRQKRIR